MKYYQTNDLIVVFLDTADEIMCLLLMRPSMKSNVFSLVFALLSSFWLCMYGLTNDGSENI